MTSRGVVWCAAMGLVFVVGCNKKDGGGSSEPPAATPSSAPAVVASQTAEKDCATIDGDAAAAILGMPAKPNPYIRHVKVQPDNMDVHTCGYIHASADPSGPTLQYTTYSPEARDMDAVWDSSKTGRHENMQSYEPNLGMPSAGWVSEKAEPDEYGAAITFRTATKIFEIRVGGFASGGAAKTAAMKAATTLQKTAGT